MPSVHIAWSTFCALALVPRMKTRGRKILAASYPALTLVVIVITANHYFVDAAGGLLILTIGWLVGNSVTHAGRAPARSTTSPTPNPQTEPIRPSPSDRAPHEHAYGVVHGLIGRATAAHHAR